MTTDSYRSFTSGSPTERSSEEIRQDISRGEENITKAMEQIGERIKEKLDWREYVMESPYLAVGIAAGLGFLASRMLVPRTTPMERIMGSVAEEVRCSLDHMRGSSQGPGLLKVALVGFTTKAAANWLKKQTS
ncbi:hypothetical protein [Fundidesulfovibrio putealis]|uniref:hypothetical protein n=1 Tax=Fundidesulfovibrio putealis TaxID=270496 RepID=UPI00048780C7|nr:hypothetical protein [Fundidesulfovibrio putealis]